MPRSTFQAARLHGPQRERGEVKLTAIDDVPASHLAQTIAPYDGCSESTSQVNVYRAHSKNGRGSETSSQELTASENSPAGHTVQIDAPYAFPESTVLFSAQ